MSDALRLIEDARARPIPETPGEWLRELGGPTLLRVPGGDGTRCRAVSTLLHGNEPSGLRAAHAWLASGAEPAVDLWIFVGAVEAALLPPGFAHRMAPGSRDLNRAFRAPFEEAAGALASALLEQLEALRPEALVDLHNNTGENPPYGVGPHAGIAELNLVGHFATRYVHSDLRLGALIEATAERFPSVVVECGRAGDPAADRVARAGLERYAQRERLERERLEPARMALLVEPVRVRIADGCKLVFAPVRVPEADLTIPPDVERHNFTTLRAGETFGWLGASGAWPIEAHAADGREVSHELFTERDDALAARRPVVPIMITSDPRVAAQDCLFYLVRPGGVRTHAEAQAGGLERSSR